MNVRQLFITDVERRESVENRGLLNRKLSSIEWFVIMGFQVSLELKSDGVATEFSGYGPDRLTQVWLNIQAIVNRATRM